MGVTSLCPVEKNNWASSSKFHNILGGGLLPSLFPLPQPFSQGETGARVDLKCFKVPRPLGEGFRERVNLRDSQLSAHELWQKPIARLG